jgi:hypothetical protein
MKTFDEILKGLQAALTTQTRNIRKIGQLIVNRDLNGIVRLVVDEKIENDGEAKKALDDIVANLAIHLESRLADKNTVIYESSLDNIIESAPHFPLKDIPNVIVTDRLLTENDWTNISPVADTHRIVFYSIKGGVGRSTALAASAWALAEQGKKVMVFDLDLESPGISSSLLPAEKCPAYGMVDWLLEDLVDNAANVLPYMTGLSDVSHNGVIYVVPAHGKEAGEYIDKLGRVWMSKTRSDNSRETWQMRLNRLLKELETYYKPDVVLIDSRAGIDEVSSACITGLGAERVLLFALDSEQTWTGYNILFRHWLRNNAAQEIRNRLQIVGSLVPAIDRQEEYIDGLCERAWDIFTSKLYDQIPADNPDAEFFNYDKSNSEAPHYPCCTFWNPGFAALQNLHEPLRQSAIARQIQSVFGELINFIKGGIEND